MNTIALSMIAFFLHEENMIAVEPPFVKFRMLVVFRV